MNPEKYISLIAMILSVGSAVGPMIFGYVFWRMTRLFVTREQFEEYKQDRKEASERLEEHICERLGTIEADIKSLLTARHRSRD